MSLHLFVLLLLLLLFLLYASAANASYNVVDFGAKPDGRTDSTIPFLRAWSAVCRNVNPISMVVPKGRFLLGKAMFHGPCNNTDVKVYIFGSIIAKPFAYDESQNWLVFRYVDGLSIYKGVLDGRGSSIWACKTRGATNCSYGATSLSINHCKNVLIHGLVSLNSQVFHVSVFGSEGVTIRNCKMIAPGNSPNTDGIHVGMSTGVTIAAVKITTGDDCISLGPGSTNVWVEKIYCGFGHGISIGSLAATLLEEGVSNVTIKTVVLSRTTNGFRIKSYDRKSHGFVNGVSFRNAIMDNVENPIIIDQNYCASYADCPNQDSGISISNVLYSNIQGTSATSFAIQFDCSPTYPCQGVRLKDINLTYHDREPESFCRNVNGSSSGLVSPPSCI